MGGNRGAAGSAARLHLPLVNAVGATGPRRLTGMARRFDDGLAQKARHGLDVVGRILYRSARRGMGLAVEHAKDCCRRFTAASQLPTPALGKMIAPERARSGRVQRETTSGLLQG